jgi:hypothetical protein
VAVTAVAASCEKQTATEFAKAAKNGKKERKEIIFD